MSHYKYQIYVPGGNKTALVLGLNEFEKNDYLRKTIQDKIFKKHINDSDGGVEQVGFISQDLSKPQLVMTGGEFCGNATRSAAAYYCKQSHANEIVIRVSGTEREFLKAGFFQHDLQCESWAEMPLVEDLAFAVTCLKDGLFWISMEGMSHLIVSQTHSVPYLNDLLHCENAESQIEIARNLKNKVVKENGLPDVDAYGVLFLENIVNVLKMHPFLFVGKAGTAHYETACGSGAVCIGLLNSFLSKKNDELILLQPSGKFIKAEVQLSDAKKVFSARISGEIEIGSIHEIECVT